MQFDENRLEDGGGVAPELVVDPHQNLVKGLDALAIDALSELIKQVEQLSDRIWDMELRLLKLERKG